MRQTSFSKWLLREGKDIFGFERELLPVRRNDIDIKPIVGFDIEEMMGYLSEINFGPRRPNVKFLNEIHWGYGPGSVRVKLGSKKEIMIDQLGDDLEGNECWFTKKVYRISQPDSGKESKVAFEVRDKIEDISREPNPTAASEYKDLENLVVSMAGKIRRTMAEIFVLLGVRKVDEHNYIIRLGLRGHGVEAPHHSRVLENQTRVSFCPKTGVIRVFNYNIESPTGEAPKWKLMENDFDWKFAPNQPREEIIETIATVLHWY